MENLFSKVRLVLEAAVLIVCAVLLWMVTHKPSAMLVNAPTIAKADPTVSDVPKVDITPAKVRVYAPEAKAKAVLPDDVKANDAIVVLESSKLPESEHAQTVTTVLNSDTGEAKTYVTVDPYPWIAGEARKEVSIGYGMKNGGVIVPRLSLSADLVQVKALHFGVGASLDGDGQYFAGVRAAYRW